MTFYPACGILKTANAKGKNAVISIDRFEEILGELAEELPAEFYTGLNGGILIEDQSSPPSGRPERRPVYHG